jgi:glycosyltransferase involved in cell wall biosynthesis
VSVVVATFNSGTRLVRTVRSLLAQTMPSSGYEVVFVDDGSTDGTAAYCRSLAEKHANIQTFTIEHTGWPGRPRNVGLDRARGEYVFFVDHDDYVFPEALERMYAYASENRSDVLLGKEVVKGGATVGWSTWKRNVPLVKELDQSVLQLLTPHKLYRRQFLIDGDVRFPEGRVRLEDYAFNAQAYVRAQRIAVLSDYPCYRWVIHGGNAHAQGLNRAAYWSSFRASLQPAFEIPPGQKRDQLLLRWYRGRVIRRVGSRLAVASPKGRRTLMADLTAVLDLFPTSLDAELPATDRARSALLRGGAHDALLTLARVDRGMVLRLDRVRCRWRPRGLTATVRATLCDGEQNPVRFEHGPSGLQRVLPEDVRRHLGNDPDLRRELAQSVVEMSVRGRRSGVEWAVPGQGRARFVRHGREHHLVVSVSTLIDPNTVVFGGPLAKDTWRTYLRADVLGFRLRARLRDPRQGDPAAPDAGEFSTPLSRGSQRTWFTRTRRRLRRRLRRLRRRLRR